MESGAEAVVQIVHADVARVEQTVLRLAHEKGNPVRFELGIAITRLVQSQPQPGAASAKPRDENPQDAGLLLLDDLAKLLLGSLCDLDHWGSSPPGASTWESHQRRKVQHTPRELEGHPEVETESVARARRQR